MHKPHDNFKQAYLEWSHDYVLNQSILLELSIFVPTGWHWGIGLYPSIELGIFRQTLKSSARGRALQSKLNDVVVHCQLA